MRLSGTLHKKGNKISCYGQIKTRYGKKILKNGSVSHKKKQTINKEINVLV